MSVAQPKKPVGGAFGIFAGEKRPEFLKVCARASEASKLAGEAWKKLSEKQREPYQKTYEVAKAKYDTDLATFLANGGTKQKGAAALRTARKRLKEGAHSPNMSVAQPKRPVGGAFGIFAAEKRAGFLKVCGRASEASKLAGEAWKKLSEKERAPYQKSYEVAKAKYETDLATFLANGGTKQKGPRALRTLWKKSKEAAMKKKASKGAPKRPAGGAYGQFLASKREKIKTSLPLDHKVADVTKKAREMWRSLSADRRQKFVDAHKVAEEKYKKEMKAYSAQKATAPKKTAPSPTMTAEKRK